jgi:hypothetical protein
MPEYCIYDKSLPCPAAGRMFLVSPCPSCKVNPQLSKEAKDENAVWDEMPQ